MIRKTIWLIIFLAGSGYLQSAFAQTQILTPDYISQKFRSYCKTIFREEIFIHTDRDEYISGEDLWFNIYLIDRQSFKPSLNSKIAYFELLGPENRPIIQRKILLDKGFGPGQIILPDTLSPGTYTIRAYTSWMKNFMPYNCFYKDVDIYNPLRTKNFLRSIKSADKTDTVPRIRYDNSGITLNINNLKPDSLEIVINADEKFRSGNNNSVYLLIQTRGIINHLSTCWIATDLTNIVIPENILPSGINQITLFDTKGPVAEKFIYTPGNKKESLILASPDSCDQRTKVTLEIAIENRSSIIGDLTNLSISVADNASDPEIIKLDDYLILGTEFGIFPGNLINGKKITGLSGPELDSLLLTLKSNWINWQEIFSNKMQLLRYPCEKEDYTISGKLLTDILQPVYADEILLMSVPGKEAVFQYATTDLDGNFNFRMPIADEPEDLIIQPDIISRNQKVYIESSFSDQYLPCEIVIDSSRKPLPPSVIRQSINYQVRKIFGTSTCINCSFPAIPAFKPKRFYGTPDLELIMKDYIKLDSIPEVFFELIPHVTLKRIKAEYEISVTDASHKRLDGTPCVMVDGVIIRDLSAVARLDPGLIEKIDVVWEKYRVGNYIFNGIVNLISKTGDLSTSILSSDAIRFKYLIADSVCSFVSPEYSSAELKQNTEADYRSTLYWNPSVKPDKNGRIIIDFWTADVKSDYIIKLSGLTSEGTAISSNKILRVR